MWILFGFECGLKGLHSRQEQNIEDGLFLEQVIDTS